MATAPENFWVEFNLLKAYYDQGVLNTSEYIKCVSQLVSDLPEPLTSLQKEINDLESMGYRE